MVDKSVVDIMYAVFSGNLCLLITFANEGGYATTPVGLSVSLLCAFEQHYRKSYQTDFVDPRIDSFLID